MARRHEGARQDLGEDEIARHAPQPEVHNEAPERSLPVAADEQQSSEAGTTTRAAESTSRLRSRRAAVVVANEAAELVAERDGEESRWRCTAGIEELPSLMATALARKATGHNSRLPLSLGGTR